MRALRWSLPPWGLVVAFAARATTINISPADSYAKIEGAQAGDEVVIAPGTYRYRVHLTQQAPASQPIVIRAQDPANPPVWDLNGILVENAPGSYTAGDRGRGCWQISGGANYQISGIVFTNCSTAGFNSAGLRYYNGARGIIVRDCIFRANDNGLTGGTQDSEITVEFSEFDRNGNLNASSSSPTHNIYIYGGTFTLRYSYVHDPVQGQNFHIRSEVGTIEYNWFARARSYQGDLMTDDDLSSGGSQSLLLRGNVIVQGSTQQNNGQVIAVYNDAGLAGMTLSVRLVNNTFIGNAGHAALVHLSNADGTSMSADLSNNIVFGTTVPVLVETSSKATVTGSQNWLATGVDQGLLTASVRSASPGFTDPATNDFTLSAGSTAIGAANDSVTGLPNREYYRDETLTRMYRPRSTVHDIGAFESTTTGPGFHPQSGGGGASTGGGVAGQLGSGCSTVESSAPSLAFLLMLACSRRRRTAAKSSGRGTR
jgi:hypothetical protein